MMRDQARQVRREEMEVQRMQRNMPEPPPPPPAPEEHFKELASRGAVFYYEGKKISPKKAISIVKNSRHIQINVTEKDSEKPEVRISKSNIDED